MRRISDYGDKILGLQGDWQSGTVKLFFKHGTNRQWGPNVLLCRLLGGVNKPIRRSYINTTAVAIELTLSIVMISSVPRAGVDICMQSGYYFYYHFHLRKFEDDGYLHTSKNGLTQ